MSAGVQRRRVGRCSRLAAADEDVIRAGMRLRFSPAKEEKRDVMHVQTIRVQKTLRTSSREGCGVLKKCLWIAQKRGCGRVVGLG